MNELEKNGLSLDTLRRLSYETHLDKNLKNTLHKFSQEAVFREISDIIEFYQNNPLLENIALDCRIKSMDSCIRKYKKYFPNVETEKVFNDILGFRMLVNDYHYLLQNELPKEIRIADMSSGKSRNDGYRGIHLYYQTSHRYYPIEIQVNSYYDRQLNNWLHKYLYKKGYPDDIGSILRVEYECGKIKNEEEFQEVLGYVLSDRKKV